MRDRSKGHLNTMLGFFDSGIGGLTILEEVRRILPHYRTIYLGDAARSPYGEKSHEQLVAYSWQGIEWLFARGCDLVIIACNSASASALREIQETKLPAYPGKRVLGVIRPTTEALTRAGHKKIVVLSTRATADSGAYPKEFQHLNPHIQIISHATPHWAPWIELGLAGTPQMAEDIQTEIRAMEERSPDYDAVLLACTHYPYIKQQIIDALSRPVPVYTQEPLVAEALADYLHRHPAMERGLEKNGLAEYFTTGDTIRSSRLAQDRFGFQVTFQHAEIEQPLT